MKLLILVASLAWARGGVHSDITKDLVPPPIQQQIGYATTAGLGAVGAGVGTDNNFANNLEAGGNLSPGNENFAAAQYGPPGVTTTGDNTGWIAITGSGPAQVPQYAGSILNGLTTGAGQSQDSQLPQIGTGHKYTTVTFGNGIVGLGHSVNYAELSQNQNPNVNFAQSQSTGEGNSHTVSLSHQTHAVPIEVPQPYEVTVTNPVPVPVAVPTPVDVPRPVPIEVLQPVAVPVEKPYPVTVTKPVPVPVPQPVYVKVPHAVHVPVAKPYPVYIEKYHPHFEHHHLEKPHFEHHLEKPHYAHHHHLEKPHLDHHLEKPHFDHHHHHFEKPHFDHHHFEKPHFDHHHFEKPHFYHHHFEKPHFDHHHFEKPHFDHHLHHHIEKPHLEFGKGYFGKYEAHDNSHHHGFGHHSTPILSGLRGGLSSKLHGGHGSSGFNHYGNSHGSSGGFELNNNIPYGLGKFVGSLTSTSNSILNGLRGGEHGYHYDKPKFAGAFEDARGKFASGYASGYTKYQHVPSSFYKYNGSGEKSGFKPIPDTIRQEYDSHGGYKY